MKEALIAVVVTALFVAAGRFAIAQLQRSQTLAARTDYALHVFMAVSMIFMSWIPFPTAASRILAVIFAGATVWFIVLAVWGPLEAPARLRVLRAYHAFMMAAMALMVIAMGSHEHAASMSGMDMAVGHHESGTMTGMSDSMTALGIVLGIVAAFWVLRTVHRLHLDAPGRRRRLGRFRLYEFSMAIGMALMSLSHQALR